jgi:hypothetical protein
MSDHFQKTNKSSHLGYSRNVYRNRYSFCTFFEYALEIVKKEFAEKGVFASKDIFITDPTGNKESCLACKK